MYLPSLVQKGTGELEHIGEFALGGSQRRIVNIAQGLHPNHGAVACGGDLNRERVYAPFSSRQRPLNPLQRRREGLIAQSLEPLKSRHSLRHLIDGEPQALWICGIQASCDLRPHRRICSTALPQLEAIDHPLSGCGNPIIIQGCSGRFVHGMKPMK